MSRALNEESIRIELQTGETVLPVRRSSRDSVALHVTRHGGFEVRAPLRMPLSSIVQFVGQHRDWLLEKEQKLQAQPSRILAYHDGATHYFLGHPLRLTLMAATKSFVAVSEGALRVATTSLDPDDVQKQLIKFYAREAELRLPERVHFWHRRMFNEELQGLSFRAMRARWGSCSGDGHIILNTSLLRATWPVIDYVVVHELCHLEYFDHGPGFKALLTKVMPDWRERKKLLNIPCGF